MDTIDYERPEGLYTKYAAGLPEIALRNLSSISLLEIISSRMSRVLAMALLLSFSDFTISESC